MGKEVEAREYTEVQIRHWKREDKQMSSVFNILSDREAERKEAFKVSLLGDVHRWTGKAAGRNCLVFSSLYTLLNGRKALEGISKSQASWVK